MENETSVKLKAGAELFEGRHFDTEVATMRARWATPERQVARRWSAGLGSAAGCVS
jgi:hypothetical protein